MLKICRPRLVASGWVVVCSGCLGHVSECVKHHRDKLEGFLRVNRKAVEYCLDIDSAFMCVDVLRRARQDVLGIVSPEVKCHYYRVVVYEVVNGRYVVLAMNMNGVVVLEPLIVEAGQLDVSHIEKIVLDELRRELVGRVYTEDRYWYTGTQLRDIVKKLVE